MKYNSEGQVLRNSFAVWRTSWEDCNCSLDASCRLDGNLVFGSISCAVLVDSDLMGGDVRRVGEEDKGRGIFECLRRSKQTCC
jgi:hypothetical protein